jgi:pimeloyl-ACP methyl ester carboxylesterase
MAVNSSGLAYDVHEGSGPYLLLVHGMLASRAQWQPNLEELSRVSRPVVVELYGHGRSPSPEDPARYRPEAYVAAFEHIREELGAERWLVCGQSLGAALTLRYALECPDRIPAQVFTNSNSALAEPGWGPAVRQALGEHAKRLQKEGRAALEASPVHPKRSRRLPAAVRAALVADCELHDPRGVGLTGVETVPDSSVRARIGENRVPSLLVVGEREKRFLAHRDYARTHMPQLHIESTDAGHAVNIEAAQPFNRIVVEFLSQFARV